MFNLGKKKAEPTPEVVPDIMEVASEACDIVTALMLELPPGHSFWIDRSLGRGKHRLIIQKWGVEATTIYAPGEEGCLAG